MGQMYKAEVQSQSVDPTEGFLLVSMTRKLGTDRNQISADIPAAAK